MSDQQDKNDTKKLKLNNSKLSLKNKLVYPKKILSSSTGPVVVEVRHGKASGTVLSSNQDLSSDKDKANDFHSERRLAALQKLQSSSKDEKNLSTLTKLAEINNDLTDPEDKKDSENKNRVDGAIPTQHLEKKPSLKKESHNKSNSDNFDKIDEETTVKTKPKNTEPKKLKKSCIINMLDQDDNFHVKTRSLASIKRAREKERRKSQNVQKSEKIYREVILPEVITVSELSNKMAERASDVIRELMKLGVMATSSQSIDADTAELMITSFGHSVKRIKESDIENILAHDEDKPEDLLPRAPIVTVMGHVDHGKTSLLDAFKKTDIVSVESGGITQHIGAYSVVMPTGQMITFIDTPGHAAFTEMRSRGSKITDIVVLVVSADDGIKPQTIEAINHAKAADVPIIVAINKIDKPGANPDNIRNQLLTHELIPEELGGDVITVEISAIKNKNLDKLAEAILLVAEMQELKVNPNRASSGVVIEARLDSAKGVIVTVIVQHGTLRKGDIIIAGHAYGRVKRICNDKGRTISDAGPSLAVEVFGLNGLASAGDVFNVVNTDKQARNIIDYRVRKSKELKVTASKATVEDLFSNVSGESKIKTLHLVIKSDVHGSLEAIISSLNKIESDEVKLKILHSGVGSITGSDVTLANASNAIILGFNVRVNNAASNVIEESEVDIRYYSIIYNLIDDIKAIMSGMLSPIVREVYIGSVDIRQIFNISRVGKIAGSYVTKGIIKRASPVRVLRDNVVIHEGKLKTLKRFKEELKEVREGFECGIALESYSDIRVGDKIEVFELVQEQKKI